MDRLEGNPAIALKPIAGRPPLVLRIGHSTRTVPNKVNEDCYGIVTPAEEPAAALRGVACAIADGVGGSGEGRIASETAIKSVLRDYYSTPDHLSASAAIDLVLRAVNDWLLTHNSRRPDLEGAVTTFSMLLFLDQRYCLVHVGDTRIYRRRGKSLRQLSHDHTWQRRDMRHVLKRAVGLDSFLVADFAEGELQAGDLFLLASDGVWEVMGEHWLQEVLEHGGEPQAMAERLTEQSVANQVKYMGRNDATAVVIAVHERGAS
jgi:serine/threonine protein phosphatase PrpC